jgi:hypothetical protein
MASSPSIVPADTDREIFIVLDDFGLSAQVWRESNDAEADRATLIRDLLDGHYEAPIRIVAFNTAQGWSRDVTEEIAGEPHQCCTDRGEVPSSLQDLFPGGARPLDSWLRIVPMYMGFFVFRWVS